MIKKYNTIYNMNCINIIFIIFIIFIVYYITSTQTCDNFQNNITENLLDIPKYETVLKYEKVCDNEDIFKLDNNICSRKCCGINQYLTDELKNIDDNTKEREKYIGSNFSCNFGNTSGCLCISKDDYKILNQRGFSESCNKNTV